VILFKIFWHLEGTYDHGAGMPHPLKIDIIANIECMKNIDITCVPASASGFGEHSKTTADMDADEALKQCEQEVAVWKDKYLRVNADIENMRRRMYKDQEQAVWRAQAEIFIPLLAVMDNFDRAQEEMAKLSGNAEFKPALDGISLIRKELVALFERFGVQEITQITQFDPGLHEALVSVETPDHTPGDIVQVLQKGYMHKGQVLRVAKVSVAR
jgi:molecular chaperone GrpE